MRSQIPLDHWRIRVTSQDLVRIVDPVNKLRVTEATCGTLTLPRDSGFALTVAVGSATFPRGVADRCITVPPLHTDEIPMVPGFGPATPLHRDYSASRDDALAAGGTAIIGAVSAGRAMYVDTHYGTKDTDNEALLQPTNH